jgi:hypothetical protein
MRHAAMRCQLPRADPRLGPAPFGRRWLPDLESGANAHEQHRLGQSGMRHQLFGDQDPSLLVDVDGESVGIERRGEILMLRT